MQTTTKPQQNQAFAYWRERLERQKQAEYFYPQAELNILRRLIETLETR